MSERPFCNQRQGKFHRVCLVLSLHSISIFPGAGISVPCARVSGHLSAAAGAGPEVSGPVCLGWEQLERSQKGFIVFQCVFQCVTTSVNQDRPASE